MQIEFLNVHRGEHLVNFDTDTPEGRAKLAEEFQRLIECGTGIFLERAGKEGAETLRVTGYDPATDKILVQEPNAPEPGEAEEEPEHVAPCPKVDADGEECACPPELKDKVAKVGDVVQAKATGRKRRGRYKVKAVDPESGKIVAVAPVSGGSGKDQKISEAAMGVLSLCRVQGSAVFIEGGQLDRKLYEEVNLVLMGIGGKWNKKSRSHVFEEPEEEVKEMLEASIQTGLAVPLHRGEFFMTPPETAEKIINLADIRDPATILEPSAGEGALIDALMALCHRREILSVDAIENDAKRFQKLKGKYADQSWLHPHEMNFFDWQPGRAYDRVLMNPPFSFLADIDHVMHAWSLLASGGRLVSVMSASVTFRREAKAQRFRELVARVGSIELLPPGSFKFSGTGVSTVIAVMNREDD